MHLSSDRKGNCSAPGGGGGGGEDLDRNASSVPSERFECSVGTLRVFRRNASSV